MRVTTMQNIFDLIREDEEKAIAQTRKEIAEEKSAWDALTQDERVLSTKLEKTSTLTFQMSQTLTVKTMKTMRMMKTELLQDWH